MKYMKLASDGFGVDRHLMGLYCMVDSKNEEIPKLFQDASYSYSKSFKLSTSNLSLLKDCFAGFAPGVEDGYGINYNIQNDSIIFSISKWTNCSSTDNYALRTQIMKSLQDVYALIKS